MPLKKAKTHATSRTASNFSLCDSVDATFPCRETNVSTQLAFNQTRSYRVACTSQYQAQNFTAADVEFGPFHIGIMIRTCVAGTSVSKETTKLVVQLGFRGRAATQHRSEIPGREDHRPLKHPDIVTVGEVATILNRHVYRRTQDVPKVSMQWWIFCNW